MGYLYKLLYGIYHFYDNILKSPMLIQQYLCNSSFQSLFLKCTFIASIAYVFDT